MAQISFTSNLNRHTPCPTMILQADTLLGLLASYFNQHPEVRDYILDDQGALRKHIVIFVDGEQANDRRTFSDPLKNDSKIFVFQALSGG